MMSLFKDVARYLIVKFRFRKKNVSFPFSCKINPNTLIEGQNIFHSNSYIRGTIGFGSYIGENALILGKVGRYCSIGNDVKVICGRHPYTYPYATTSPMFFSLSKQNGRTFAQIQEFEENTNAEGEFPVVIGNDVWINSHVRIVSSVKIGHGAVLLAGSVITKDVPPYAIVGGIPAKVIKYRYSDEDRAFLLNLQWWNKPQEWLRDNYKALLNIEKLKILMSL